MVMRSEEWHTEYYFGGDGGEEWHTEYYFIYFWRKNVNF